MFALFLVCYFGRVLTSGQLIFQEILPHVYKQAYVTDINMKKDVICLPATPARTFLPEHISSHSRGLIFVAATEETKIAQRNIAWRIKSVGNADR